MTHFYRPARTALSNLDSSDLGLHDPYDPLNPPSPCCKNCVYFHLDFTVEYSMHKKEDTGNKIFYRLKTAQGIQENLPIEFSLDQCQILQPFGDCDKKGVVHEEFLCQEYWSKINPEKPDGWDFEDYEEEEV